jgi:hypothetical protein
MIAAYVYAVNTSDLSDRILWHDAWKPNNGVGARRPLQGNDSVNAA